MSWILIIVFSFFSDAKDSLSSTVSVPQDRTLKDSLQGQVRVAGPSNRKVYTFAVTNGPSFEIELTMNPDKWIWTGFQLTSKKSVLSSQHKRFLIQAAELDALPSGLSRLLRALPEGEDLKPVESSPDWSKDREVKYEMICESRGKKRRGYYDVGRRNKSWLMLVGGKHRCYGRCGNGCIGPKQYTQECLNHDACAYRRRENLGECKNEFDAAAHGFFEAPDCPPR